MAHAHVRASQLCFSWPDGTPVFDTLSFTLGARRTGLVAPNGAGKSTLLRLVAGELTPSSGVIDLAGTFAYLPQQTAPPAHRRVADVRIRPDSWWALVRTWRIPPEQLIDRDRAER